MGLDFFYGKVEYGENARMESFKIWPKTGIFSWLHVSVPEVKVILRLLTQVSHNMSFKHLLRSHWPIVTRFYVQPSGAERTKIYSNGRMTNRVAMPIDSKNL